MKTLIIALSLALGTHLLATELSWVDEQVQAIKPTRVGMSKNGISVIQDPFIFLEKNRLTKAIPMQSSTAKSSSKHTLTTSKFQKQNHTKVQISTPNTATSVLSLGIIMNNSAMINGKWHKKGERVDGYLIKKITYDSVLLHKNNKKILLSTKSRIKKLKFQK